MPSPIVTIFGGSGFIGRYVARRMARAGWRVRVAVRRPNEALFVRTYGVVGQVEPVQANIRDEDSVRRAVAGATAVVNCVGIMVENGKQQFDAVQDEGAGRVARLAAAAGATRLVHVSAIGADAGGDSLYARSKAAGEAAVLAAFPGAVILRPSIVFGVDDAFFNRFGRMARISPVIPLVSPGTRFQPVYVDDVAAAAEAAARGDAAPGVYELGGPDVASFRALIERLLDIVRRRRLIVTVPAGLAALQGSALDFAQRISFGAFVNEMLTRDQVRLLAHDNVVAPGAKGLADLGVAPTAMAAVLESYLYAYRPGGQYAAIKDSAAQLRS
ncbi:complex I NDUFA9 subunit family protein [Amaricoccus sp.]|uniref:complex I NDUFA9 subunit family protein n=1 Tax=Amaricoccus sp. TaxID=1872485 RepID=UPI001B6C8A3A|nr:complex I NDUFA9 subunit family protein [Amaricoccus sp.]MBP7001158.1 complex I NDUFA9 subunit family protein [Amaricoccus sp.]